MCGRFVNLNTVEKLDKIFSISKHDNIKYKISYNISPSQLSLIITNFKFLKIENAKWGFNFFDKQRSIEKQIINSRLETIKEKMMFKDSFEKRKCIIPANGYYEWTLKNNIKIPYFIHIPEKETIYFAGIWRYLNIKENALKVFSIITKPANKLLKEIHHRMPVILSFNESKEFLENNNSNYLNDIHSSIDEYFEFFKVSKFVNNPINNSYECIKPIN